jgi:predicted nucleic acid-binding protein
VSNLLYLLDSNVVSELRKASSGKADQKVIAWAASVPVQAMRLSVISVLEIELGIRQLERRDTKQSRHLRLWLNSMLLPAFSGRVLNVDLDIALTCASLHVPNPRPERDALIAATAVVHGTCLVTRNTRDFEGIAVELINPWL